MAKGKRNIGREIPEGLREIESGRHGRVVNLPGVASVREKTGLSQERFATLLGDRYEHYRTGNKVAERGRRGATSQACPPSLQFIYRRKENPSMRDRLAPYNYYKSFDTRLHEYLTFY